MSEAKNMDSGAGLEQCGTSSNDPSFFGGYLGDLPVLKQVVGYRQGYTEALLLAQDVVAKCNTTQFQVG